MGAFAKLGSLLIGSLVLGALLAPNATASPLDLSDPAPRWIAVAFEISPAKFPTRRRANFTPRLPARVEPSAEPGQMRVRVAGELVERFLLPDHEPMPGSFGDFVWTFDVRTGHVTSARLEGAVRKEVRWGFARWTTDAHIRVRMNSHTPVSFETVELMGEQIHGLCESPTNRDCTRVDPTGLDPVTGYVNAVGALHVDTGPINIESFSPLGEAIFSEVDAAPAKFWSHGLEDVVRVDVSAPPPGRAEARR